MRPNIVGACDSWTGEEGPAEDKLMGPLLCSGDGVILLDIVGIGVPEDKKRVGEPDGWIAPG